MMYMAPSIFCSALALKTQDGDSNCFREPNQEILLFKLYFVSKPPWYVTGLLTVLLSQVFLTIVSCITYRPSVMNW